MNRDEIKRIALDCGFKLKQQPDGSMDLNPYVYKFAEMLIFASSEHPPTRHCVCDECNRHFIRQKENGINIKGEIYFVVQDIKKVSLPDGSMSEMKGKIYIKNKDGSDFYSRWIEGDKLNNDKLNNLANLIMHCYKYGIKEIWGINSKP